MHTIDLNNLFHYLLEIKIVDKPSFIMVQIFAEIWNFARMNFMVRNGENCWQNVKLFDQFNGIDPQFP